MLEAEYRQLTSLGAFQVARLCHPRLAPAARRAARHSGRRRHPRLYRRQWPVRAEPGLERDRSRPLRHRPHLHAPLRHFARRPAALVRRCRADHRRQLHLDRRLGVPGPAGSPTSQACSRSPCRRSTPAGGWPIRCSAAGSSSRRTAWRSSAPRARTASAPSPARAGSGAAITPLGQELVLTALCARRRLSCQRHPADPDRQLSRRGRLERRASSARSRPTCDGRWSARSWAAPSASRRASSSSPRRRPRIWTSPTRMPARSTSRIRNLFALNRFPGYDRWEDGVRITYGVDWAVDLPGVSVRTTIGQSYRLDRQPSILPPGTGLSGRLLRHRRPDRRCASAGSSASPTASGSTRTAWRSAATRSTP